MFLIRDVLVGCSSNGVWVLEEPNKQPLQPLHWPAQLVRHTIKGGEQQVLCVSSSKVKEDTVTWSCKAKMTVTLEAILLLLVGYSSLTDGASKLLQKY